jgi:drug/metabolite transporter (DMT)-like permease
MSVTYHETIGQGHDRALMFRSLQSAWSNMIKTISQKYISLIVVGVIMNLAPPLTVVLAFVWLGETLGMFGGVLMAV